MRNLPPARFRYFGDPVCIGSILIYALNRWYLKPHHLGGAFTHGYLNDLLCLPLFLPLILYVQKLLGLRRHYDPPRLWEIVQHAIIFSVIFEVILPRYPHYFRTTADPLDALAYLVGGLVGWVIWRRSLLMWLIVKWTRTAFGRSADYQQERAWPLI